MSNPKRERLERLHRSAPLDFDETEAILETKSLGKPMGGG